MGYVLALRSSVSRFKPGSGRWIFSGQITWVEVHRELFEVVGNNSEISGSLKNLMSEKIGLWRKFNPSLVPIQLAHEAMDLLPITLPLV